MAKRASSLEHVYEDAGLAANAENADAFNERFLTCTICLDTYSDTPKLLPCLHSFCESCIAKIADGKSEFSCPVCRRNVELSSQGAKGLPNNIFIRDLQDFLTQQNRPRSESLSAVDSDSSNNLYIRDLQDFLSEQPNRPRVESERDVRQVTQRPRAASAAAQPPKINKHASSNVFQRVALKIKLPFRSKHKRYCQYHSEKELKQYCQQCQQIVCKKCVRLEHSEEGHYVMDLSLAADNSKRHLKSLLFQAQTLVAPLEHGKGATIEELQDSDYDIVAASCPLVARMEEVVALSNRQRTEPVTCGSFSLDVNTEVTDEIRNLAADVANLSISEPREDDE
ncbi:probable E3 ubiquitin-protein ligase MID2 [Amphiura filiformis]|uniref:probable E3 ubiquitin-protein ligase MID2 n=1 Tax=Amphiura filiformis TaxID=82378 RepID=UPI003B21CEEF